MPASTCLHTRAHASAYQDYETYSAESIHNGTLRIPSGRLRTIYRCHDLDSLVAKNVNFSDVVIIADTIGKISITESKFRNVTIHCEGVGTIFLYGCVDSDITLSVLEMQRLNLGRCTNLQINLASDIITRKIAVYRDCSGIFYEETECWTCLEEFFFNSRKKDGRPHAGDSYAKDKSSGFKNDSGSSNNGSGDPRGKQQPPPKTPPRRPGFKPKPLSATYEEWKWLCSLALADKTQMLGFPEPPSSHCGDCAMIPNRKLATCKCDLKTLFESAKNVNSREAYVRLLKVERLQWHPDTFCTVPTAVRVEVQAKATELFQLIGQLLDAAQKQ